MRTVLLLFASLVAAAQPRFSAPVAGYVFDGSGRTIRAVVGVPGAASAGDSISLNDSFSTAFVHPSLQLAAGIGKDGAVFAANWTDPLQPQCLAIAPQFGTPDRIFFASSSDRALLISGRGVEVWSDLGSRPTSVYAYTADALGGVPKFGALSSDGVLGAVVLDSVQIVEVSQSGIRPAGTGTSATYLPLTSDLAVLGADGTLSLQRGGDTTALVRGLELDAELAVVPGFNGVLAISNQKGTLSLIDVLSGQLTSLNCNCRPNRPQPLSMPGLLFFSDTQRGGLLLDNTNGSTPRIVPLIGIEGATN